MEREKAYLIGKGWVISRKDGIVKTFKFKNFSESIEFTNKVALKAEESEHHPEIVISYDKVTIKCITHDTGGITWKDLHLALDCLHIYDSMSD